ncbi:gephyrin-like molybdotransferase receptor GlpR [Streptomyces sp. NRRL B-1347]|uniref:divisome protein SepX/GlpR n=1 Tax=Streptomyces sp. NRRL B-1347 TaxID=1476877 RepID=UPI0004CA0A21|nr:gephyrin-like molybdotransferase receptor GlpR [Streptomyces sp. NRRL B-1347]
MSSSGLFYAVIVGAWAAYLVPMWLRRQDELNEARPTERFSTAIRLLSGRAGMERRYAKDLRARTSDSSDEEESRAEPDAATDSVDVRAFAMLPDEDVATEPRGRATGRQRPRSQAGVDTEPHGREPSAQEAADRRERRGQGRPAPDRQQVHRHPRGAAAERQAARGAAEAAARARRSKVLARRRRTTVMLFFAFTLGAVAAAVGGVALLWVPGVPAALLSAYIVYLRRQERRRFTYTMDRRRAEAAARQLRARQPRRAEQSAEPVAEEPVPEADPGLSALAADRRALVEQTDHAEWVDQQRERRHGPGRGDSWDPVPVPLPTYVTAPVAPRATGSVDLGAPDTWSSARSSTAEPAADGTADRAERDRTERDRTEREHAEHEHPAREERTEAVADDARSDARRAASARRSRERGRTPLFDQYDDAASADGRPRAANE